MPEAVILTMTSRGPGSGSGKSIISMVRSPAKYTPFIGSVLPCAIDLVGLGAGDAARPYRHPCMGVSRPRLSRRGYAEPRRAGRCRAWIARGVSDDGVLRASAVSDA